MAFQSDPSGLGNGSFPSSAARTHLRDAAEKQGNWRVISAGTGEACVRGDDSPWVLGARQVAHHGSGARRLRGVGARKPGGLVDPPRAPSIVYCTCWNWRQCNRPIETNPSRQQLVPARATAKSPPTLLTSGRGRVAQPPAAGPGVAVLVCSTGPVIRYRVGLSPSLFLCLACPERPHAASKVRPPTVGLAYTMHILLHRLWLVPRGMRKIPTTLER